MNAMTLHREQDGFVNSVPLSIDLRDEGSGSIRLIVSGALDLATMTRFGEYVRAGCDHKPRELLLDFTGLTFCDSSGVRECIRAARGCDLINTRMRIVGASANIRRVFDAAGIVDRFEWIETDAASGTSAGTADVHAS